MPADAHSLARRPASANVPAATGFALLWALAALGGGCLLTRTVAHDDAGADAQAPQPPIRFADVSCNPNVRQSMAVPEGTDVTCSFRVEAPPGKVINLSCETPAGFSLDCSQASAAGHELRPFGGTQAPVVNGQFTLATQGLAGPPFEIIWIADDGVGPPARLNLHVPVVPPGMLDLPPHITLSCGGDTDGELTVAAGDRLSCALDIADGDPGDSVSWRVEWPPEQTLQTAPTPAQGQGPSANIWQWQSAAAEAGRQLVFWFTADDGIAPPVRYDLSVDVQ